jgi:hypothetical protein
MCDRVPAGPAGAGGTSRGWGCSTVAARATRRFARAPTRRLAPAGSRFGLVGAARVELCMKHQAPTNSTVNLVFTKMGVG